MKFKSDLSLRTQLAIAMTSCVLIAFAFGYIGLTIFATIQRAHLEEKLPAPALSALAKFEADTLPTKDEFRSLVISERILNNTLNRQQDVAMIILISFAGLVCVIGAFVLSHRIAEPLEVVAKAIRRVAEGDMSARAVPKSAGSDEASRLVADFNSMAAAIERYDRELTEGAAAIAHELRTPLTILRGRLQGMQDGVFIPSPSEISSLITQVDSLARLVDDLQTVSLAEVGVLQLHKVPVDLVHLLAELAQFLGAEIEAAGMKMELNLQPAQIQADPIRLRQAVLALITNAARYGGSGGVVEIDCSLNGQDGLIYVRDRGPGLSKRALENAFRLFWREDPSRARDLGGSGIGLAVVDAIIRAHGGRVTASPRDGGGAEFELRLPSGLS